MTKDNLLHFVCAKCETHLSVDPAIAGTKAPCPSCGKDITAPAKPQAPAGSSSLEKVKKAVESKPAKPDSKTSLQKETQKVLTAPVSLRAEPVNPKSGLTKTQEERGEFSAVIKLLVLGGIALIAVLIAIYYNQQLITGFLDANF